MRRLTLLLGLALLVATAAGAQEILLDQMVEAGGLKCYPVHGDPTSWYYLPDQPHVAADDSDRPQFSFLMYSSPEQRGEEGITEAPGGGVAHLLVAYDVPEDMVRRAQSELARTQPGARLKGPAAYTDGTFNLVTAVTDPEAGLSRRVVGVGNAPVMSGHKAAVSMHLTPTGAMLLWESFSQRTPDISVTFEMTVSGYRNPVEATMKLDYERIHRTIELEAGVDASFLEADVEMMLGKMVDNGAISIELKGAPPEQWQEVQKLGLELAKHHLFENLGAAPLNQISELTRSGGSNRRSSLHDPMTETIEMIALPPPDDDDEPSQASQRAREHFDRGVRLFDAERYREAIQEFDQSYSNLPHSLTAWNIAFCYTTLRQTAESLTWLNNLREISEEARESALFSQLVENLEAADNPRMTTEQNERVTELAQQVYSELYPTWRERGRPETETIDFSDDEPELVIADAPSDSLSAGDTSATEGQGSGETESPFRDNPFDDDAAAGAPATPTTAGATATGRGADAMLRPSGAAASRAPARTPSPTARDRSARSGDNREQGGSRIQISIAFRYRKIQRSGAFTVNMKQWNRVEIPIRFAANVGDLSRYMDDARMFRRVSLNDPMFKQREIPVTVDVASEQVFADMLNAVTVTLKKRHGSGRETLDEVTIQRSDFASGEVETMVYGWDGDDNRDRWLEYDHRVRWSYAGGPVVETGWQRTTAGALVLEPPLRPRELTLEADPVLLREQGVRDVVVEVRYPAGDAERLAHATVRPSDEVGRQVMRLYQDPQSPTYTYSFDWRMYGGRRVEAGPFEDSADFIYLDEIPR